MMLREIRSHMVLCNKFNQICVIGSGVMGAGISAHIASAGIKVLLFDIPSKEQNGNSISGAAIERMLSASPSPFSHPSKAEFITACNLDSDLEKIRDCDLVIEAIIEDISIKHSLYQKLLPYLKEDAILASNTSTLNLSALKNGLTKSLRKRFLILHFFNPPRYMELLELVKDEETSDKAIKYVSEFVSRKLGKQVVECKDTPGFIANRIGCFLLELSLRKTLEHKVDIEIIDYIMSKYLYLPNTGIFGLYDLIGLDVMSLISKSLYSSLPERDRFKEIYTEVPQINKMISLNYLGRKSGAGFYRIIKLEDGSKINEVIDLTTLEYKRCIDVKFDFKDINEILSLSNNIGTVIREIILEFGSYVASLVNEISDNIYDIDKAMRLGYNWTYGPFELFYTLINNGFSMIDQDSRCSNFIAKKEYLYIESEGFSSKVNSLEKHTKKILFQNASCKLSMLNNSEFCFSMSTKMNCLNHEVFNSLIEAILYAEKEKQRLYIYSDTNHFSAGADLNILLAHIYKEEWVKIEEFIALGQNAMQKMKYSTAEIISCPSGVALGGGTELLLHSSYICATDKLIAGLVEVGLGLIPGFGGTKEMILRGIDSPSKITHNLRNIVMSTKTLSADSFSYSYGVDLLVNMNRRYMLEEAMHIKNTKIVTNYDANREYLIPVFDLNNSIDLRTIDDHTKNIIDIFQTISSKEMREDQILLLERELFMHLISSRKVQLGLEKICR